LLLALAAGQALGALSDDIARATDLAYGQQYDSALAVTSAVIARDPSNPAGYYWHAGIIQLLINDSGQDWLADSFYHLSDRALALCRQRLAVAPNDPQANLYFGLTQLNRASLLAWQQQLVSAFRVVVGVPRQLNAALARDSSLTDARFGLGMLEYLKATTDRYLPVVRLGSRRNAYALIKPIADGSGPRKAAAELMMAYMSREDRNYDQAFAYCRRVLAGYPGNRSALRLMRDAMVQAGRYAEAVQTCATLDSLIDLAFPSNRYGKAENWLEWGKAYTLMGMKQEARDRFDRVIAWEQYQNVVPWLRFYVRVAKQWRAKLGN